MTVGGTSELPNQDDAEARDSSPKKFLSKRKSSKGDAIPAAISKLNVSSNGLVDQPAEQQTDESTKAQDSDSQSKADEPPLPPDPPKTENADDKSKTAQNQGTWGWTSWWSRPDGYSEPAKPADKASSEAINEAQKLPLPDVTPSEQPDSTTKELGTGKDPEQAEEQLAEPKEGPPQPTADAKSVKDGNTPTRSWFWLWSSAQNAQTIPPPAEQTEEPPKPSDNLEPPKPPAPEAPVTELARPVSEPTEPKEIAKAGATTDAKEAKTPPKASGWAFWSRSKPQGEDQSAPSEPHKHVGELAVMDTPSQSQPEAAQFNEQEVAPQKPVKQKAKSLRGRPKQLESSAESSKTATPSKTSPAPSPSRVETAPKPQPAPKQAGKAKEEPKNLLLPEFRNTYHLVQKPSYWKQIRQYFQGGEQAMPHLHINPAPPRIKKAIAIGVHGYFPAPIIQKVLGQPTGTSIRFANAAAAAIQEWTEARGYSAEIEKVALEGEGFVSDRVNTLWKLLLNWVDHIKSADFILVACHSQGVPVAVMLVAKLIQFGCVNAARIGICAMAGVNLGPFAEYRTKYLGATAAELFQFSDPKSLVSQMYHTALEESLRYGVRILYVGSIDDQLVSLEVSIPFSPS